jgi:predicted ArsR family transcriptional regulator
MSVTLVGTDPRVQIFSSTKYEIILLLKHEESSDLESLSKKLGVSQMAVYKHLRELEKDGLVAHVARRNGVGRPRMYFRPTAKSAGVFPSSYAYIALLTLQYVEDRLGKEGLEDVARRVQDRAVGRYLERVGDGSLYQRAKRLAALREEHGFLGDVKSLGNGSVEIMSNNCPVGCIVSKYPSLCEQERMMLQRVLDTKVELVNVDPQGGEPCKFVATGGK